MKLIYYSETAILVANTSPIPHEHNRMAFGMLYVLRIELDVAAVIGTALWLQNCSISPTERRTCAPLYCAHPFTAYPLRHPDPRLFVHITHHIRAAMAPGSC